MDPTIFYLIALLVAVVIMNWRFVGLDRLFNSRRSRSGGVAGAGEVATRSGECRWRRDETRGGARPARFVCAACGAEACRADGAPPETCRRGDRPVT